MKFKIILLALLVVAQYNYGQTYKFGKVSKEELEQKFYPQDSSANAAILYKKTSENQRSKVFGRLFCIFYNFIVYTS